MSSTVSTDPLMTLTLGEARESWLYFATCQCGRHVLVDLEAACNALGEVFPVRELGKRLRCSGCGAKRNGPICFLRRDEQTGGDLLRAYRKKLECRENESD